MRQFSSEGMAGPGIFRSFTTPAHLVDPYRPEHVPEKNQTPVDGEHTGAAGDPL